MAKNTILYYPYKFNFIRNNKIVNESVSKSMLSKNMLIVGKIGLLTRRLIQDVVKLQARE